MNVSVFGLGYVGVVTAACLARAGHTVIGVDVSSEKVEAVNAGQSPIVEPGLSPLLLDGARSGRLSATTDAGSAVADSEISLVSVGTPSSDSGAPDLSHVFAVSAEIGDAIAGKAATHVFVLRSTVPPGTLRRCASIVAERAPRETVHFAFNPEFLREGSAIADFEHPCYTVVGTDSRQAEAALRILYADVSGSVLVVQPEVSEMVKYVANCWHAAKIGFANEVGRLAKALGVDGRIVMDIITQDTKLNVSSTYMKPGYAYGGSCLPKDVRAFLSLAQSLGVAVPMLAGLPLSNQAQIDAAVNLVLSSRPQRVAVFGLAFKDGTDDLRESPAVPLVKRLLGEGCEIKIFSPDVNEARLLGTNLAFIRERIPHFERLLVDDPAEAVEWSDVVVVTHPGPQFGEALEAAPSETRIVDLAGAYKGKRDCFSYDGIAW